VPARAHLSHAYGEVMAATAGPDNPWLSRRVLAYAHQGGAKEAPSSTLHALRQAVAAGADALELDVHRSADGHLMVCHDATVDRTTDAVGAIAGLTLAELVALDNAYWWVPGSVVDHEAEGDAYVFRGRAPGDPAFGIATLADVLREFPTTPLNLDIKQTAPEVVPYEAELAALLQEHGRGDDVIVASFNDSALDVFGALDCGVPTSCGPRAVAELAVALANGDPVPAEVLKHVAVQVPPSFGGHDVVTIESVEALHDAGVAVHVWTIDETDEMERLVGLGVDGIMTDRPEALVAVLGSLGVRWDAT
jgi:glycerophosphoryl diester phosphodiesterase